MLLRVIAPLNRHLQLHCPGQLALPIALRSEEGGDAVREGQAYHQDNAGIEGTTYGQRTMAEGVAMNNGDNKAQGKGDARVRGVQS